MRSPRKRPAQLRRAFPRRRSLPLRYQPRARRPGRRASVLAYPGREGRELGTWPRMGCAGGAASAAAGRPADRGADRSQRRPGGARRGRGGQDRAAGLPGRVGGGSAGWCGRRGWSRRWSWRSPGCISCARRCWTPRAAAGTAAGRRCETAFGLQRQARRRTGSWSAWRCSSLLSEAAEDRPLVCVVDDAAVAGSGVGAGAGVRGAAAGGRPGGTGVRRPGAGMRSWRAARAGGAGLRERRRPRIAGLGGARGRWTRGSATRSWPRPGETRWPCWSCHAG